MLKEQGITGKDKEKGEKRRKEHALRGEELMQPKVSKKDKDSGHY